MNNTKSLISYLGDKEFVVTKTLGKVPKGSLVRIYKVNEEEQTMTLEIVDHNKQPKKIPINTKKEFSSVSQTNFGTKHTVSVQDALANLSEPVEQHGLKINLSALKQKTEQFEDADLMSPHLKLSADGSYTISVEGFISMHTKNLTGMVVLDDTTRNGLPYCIAFVDFDTYEDAAFEMIDNTVQSEELFKLLSPFAIDRQHTKYRTEKGEKVIGIKFNNSYTIPEYEGVRFFRLSIPWYDVYSKTTSKQIRAILNEIVSQTDESARDLILNS